MIWNDLSCSTLRLWRRSSSTISLLEEEEYRVYRDRSFDSKVTSENHPKIIRRWSEIIKRDILGDFASVGLLQVPFFFFEQPRCSLTFCSWQLETKETNNQGILSNMACGDVPNGYNYKLMRWTLSAFCLQFPDVGMIHVKGGKAEKKGSERLEWLDIKISYICNCLFIYNR